MDKRLEKLLQSLSVKQAGLLYSILNEGLKLDNYQLRTFVEEISAPLEKRILDYINNELK